jgi:endonuclease G, mitochondrial
MPARKSRRPRRVRPLLWFNALLLGLLAGWYAFQPAARRAEVDQLIENYLEREKGIDLLDVVWDLHQLYASEDFVRIPGRAGDGGDLYAGRPRPDGFPHAVRSLVNRGYTVGYSDVLENPVWVAYRVRDRKGASAPAARPDRFAVDLRTAARVAPEAYLGSGYDRGHLAPSHAIAVHHGEDAQRETFLMSNIVPQRHALNAGPWKALERRIATSYPGRFGEVWVLAGPIFGTSREALPNGTVVPESFFMILLDESDGRLRALGIILPQSADAARDLDRHLVSIDEIERRTGFDFLPELADGTEAALEARIPARVW